MSAALKPTHPPSGWQIMKVMELVNQHLATIQPDPDPEIDGVTDSEALLEVLKAKGADIGQVMEALLLAADEAKTDAEAIKARRDRLLLRQQRRDKHKDTYRAAAMAIMAEFPELFRPSAKSKSLAAFRSALVEARVQRGQDGVVITDPGKLMQQERFVTRSLNTAAVKTAVVEDGEVLDGAELKNGAPVLYVKTT